MQVTIDGVDVTKQVAAMYDAIVGSLDWGSDFLDSETVAAILLVGRMAGFAIPGGMKPPPGVLPPYSRDNTWAERRRVAQAKWEAQYLAELDARIQEMKGQV